MYKNYKSLNCYDDLSAFGSSIILQTNYRLSGLVADCKIVTDVISLLPYLSLSETIAVLILDYHVMFKASN